MPSAASSEMDPVGITSIGARVSSPSRMIAPRPNCRSIWARAASRDFSLSPPPLLLAALSFGAMRTPVGIRGFPPCRRLPAVLASRSYAALAALPDYVINLSAPTLCPATDSPAAQLRRRRLARPGKAADTVSSATLDEQLFDHERNAPIRSKIT